MDAVDQNIVEQNDMGEFNHINLTGGVDTIADEDLFVIAEEEQEVLNAFDGITDVVA